MFFQSSIGFACVLQLLNSANALPTELQQPLSFHKPKDVQTVRAELKKAEIIPTVIDDFLPSLTLSISWPNKHAKLGNTLKPKHLQTQPTITLHDETSPSTSTKSNLTYIITLTDPDAPSRTNPKWSEMCHWIAANISISESTFSIPPLPDFGLTRVRDASRSPDDVMEYKPPGPPPKTGKHRYVFLVFAPRNGTTEGLRLSRPEERRHWGRGEVGGGVRDWAGENGLVAVAANFVYSEDKKQ